jgi:hypothetical protein
MSLTGYPFGGGTYNLLTTMTDSSGNSVDPLGSGYKPPNNGETTLQFSVNPQNEGASTFAKYVIAQSNLGNNAKNYVEIKVNKQFFPGANPSTLYLQNWMLMATMLILHFQATSLQTTEQQIFSFRLTRKTKRMIPLPNM